MKIVSKEIKSDKLQMLWTIVFILYMAVTLSFFMNSMFEERDYINPTADVLMLIFIPMLGFYFSRRSFKYLTEDSYTQMLYYYRSIPVPAEAVIVSRIFMGLLAFAINGIIFFGVIYVLADDLRYSMDLMAYISFGLTWIGIGILTTGLLIYFEFMKSGKVYCLITFLLMTIIAVVLWLLFIAGIRFSLFDYITTASKRRELLSPVMWSSLVIGIAGFAGMCRLTLNHMKQRDLS